MSRRIIPATQPRHLTIAMRSTDLNSVRAAGQSSMEDGTTPTYGTGNAMRTSELLEKGGYLNPRIKPPEAGANQHQACLPGIPAVNPCGFEPAQNQSDGVVAGCVPADGDGRRVAVGGWRNPRPASLLSGCE
jgi:hypothetical protein